MKILPVNNFNNPFNLVNNKIRPKHTIDKSESFNFGFDSISFSGKKYDADDIENPTYHCAYCGCKVYNQAQIDSIAKEILQSRASRLEGKVKSVLEKLEGAKNAQDIALAKRLENDEQIKFFKNFLDISEKKSFMRGDAIFEQVYNLDSDEALDLLVKNMTPLLRTVDHVSPQNEDKDNNNSDVNLVEACYCCNHDLKKGASFSEFYAIFPSIKNNMPQDKFNYAVSSVLDSSQSSITHRISAQSMLKLIGRLFIQRTEAYNYLQSIDHRIKGCQSSVQEAIDTCRGEIQEKNNEVADLRSKLDKLMQDPEYVALLNRNGLVSKLESQNTALDSLRFRWQKTSDAINELQNPSKNKKSQAKMTDKEKEDKITLLKGSLSSLSVQIEKQKELVTATELEILEQDEKFPTIDMLQQEKNRAEAIAKAHIALASERAALEKKRTEKTQLEEQEAQLSAQIEKMPQNSASFNANEYSENEHSLYSHYLDLIEAIKYIDEHPNGGSVKSIIKDSAKKSILSEIANLEKEDIIGHYITSVRRKDLEQQLAKIRKSIEALCASISESEKACEKYEKDSSPMGYEEVQEKIASLSETMRRLNEKSVSVKIPQYINTINMEIALLQNTIDELSKKNQEIDSAFNVTV